jgi:hypothetical protein
MIEILHFKQGAKIIKLNIAVTNLNVPGEFHVPTAGEIIRKRTI